MNAKQGFPAARLQAAIKLLLVTAALFIGTHTNGLAQVTGGLIGVSPGFPQVSSSGIPAPTFPPTLNAQCQYVAGAQTLTIDAVADLYFPDASTLDPINTGALSLTATIDNAGNFVSGSFSITGTTVGGLTDPLLDGDIMAMGFENTAANPGGSDRVDFRATPTGGSIFTGPDWPGPGFDITATFNLGGSNYSGNFVADWDCSDASNILVGAQFFPPPVTEIFIGIKVAPGEDPGCLEIDGNGVVPVALLGDATFGVGDVDQDTLTFQGLEVSMNGGSPECVAQEISGDGFTDLVCQFADDLNNWVPTDSDNIATLEGALFSGIDIFGSEQVCFVEPPPGMEIDVEIDVLPGSDPGCISINGKGVVPVAILGSATFDVLTVDQASLTFQGLDIGARGANDDPDCDADDVNGDGELDLICRFEDDEEKWMEPGDDDLGTLLGMLLDGATMISGSEEVCLVGKKSSNVLGPLWLGLLLPLALLGRKLRKV